MGTQRRFLHLTYRTSLANQDQVESILPWFNTKKVAANGSLQRMKV